MSQLKEYQLLHYQPPHLPLSSHRLFLQLLLPQLLSLLVHCASSLSVSFRGNSSMIFHLLCPLSSLIIYNLNSFWLSACLTVTSSIYSYRPVLQVFPVAFHLWSCQYSSQVVSFPFSLLLPPLFLFFSLFTFLF